MKALVIIPARGGSKGIPRKNIKSLGGKPLINYTIEAALGVFNRENIIVSTDSEAIKKCAEECGIQVPFLRPEHLSTDTASSQDVLIHTMEYADSAGLMYDSIVLLQPTSPFRTSKHIHEAVELYSNDLDMVVSVKESDENPYYSIFEESEQGYLKKSKEGNFTRRQDCPKVYSYNGAIYVINPESLKRSPIGQFNKVRKYVMKSEDSVDLDTPLDWKIAEMILAEKN